jgi:DNA-binding NtrC family response regulator
VPDERPLVGVGRQDASVPTLGVEPPLVAGRLAGLTVREMERRLIAETLAYTNDNRTRAAKILGISIRTLRNKINEYRAIGIEVP